MQYYFRHWMSYILTFVASSKNCFYARNLIKFTKLSFSLKKKLLSPRFLLPLLLLCSLDVQALSAQSTKVIQGSAPYFTYDGGQTKISTTEELLSIKLSDGQIITPQKNMSSPTNPIELPQLGDSFSDIAMLVPVDVNSIALNALLGPPYHYWGDDDGDGQGANGASATGTLTVDITDKDDNAVNRNTVLNICDAPYKVVLTSSDGSLSTRYGMPNNSTFDSGSAVYYIKPKGSTRCHDDDIKYVRPNLLHNNFAPKGALGIFETVGHSYQLALWSHPYTDNDRGGFLVQSTKLATYEQNFPTTGANGLYFYLDMDDDVNPSELSWPSVSQGGITASMTVEPPKSSAGDGYHFERLGGVKVTLTGPTVTAAQRQSSNPGTIAKPTLPQLFVLKGYDKSNNVVIKYGFVLKQWFVHRGTKRASYSDSLAWCNSLGYRQPKIKDITNAKCGLDDRFPCVNGINGTVPTSNSWFRQRRIDAGFSTEWGDVSFYIGSSFFNDNYDWHWTSDVFDRSSHFVVSPAEATVYFHWDGDNWYSLCTYP
jgi:hypothetical protein